MQDDSCSIANVRLLDGRLVTIAITDGIFTAVRDQNGETLSLPYVPPIEEAEGAIDQNFDAHGEIFVPGAIDGHIHSRDPGFPEKEDWTTIARGAYAGGVVGVVDMPNTIPPTLDLATLADKAERARKSEIDARFLLGVTVDTVGKLHSTLRAASQLPLAGVKVFYGQSTGNLAFADLDALQRNIPSDYSGILVFHAEDQCCIEANTSMYSSAAAVPYAIHSDLRSPEAAIKATHAILTWALQTKRRVHIAHVSTPEEVIAVRGAQRDGANVSCEVAPHHLLFTTADYIALGGRLKVNPPVRQAEMVAQLRAAFANGAFDCFATDHAPHTQEEKVLPYAQCPSGLPALELYWPLLSQCQRQSGGTLRPEQMLACSAERPAQLFGFAGRGKMAPGYAADFVWLQQQVLDVSQWHVISRCGWTPYNGMVLPIQVRGTWSRGVLRYANW